MYVYMLYIYMARLCWYVILQLSMSTLNKEKIKIKKLESFLMHLVITQTFVFYYVIVKVCLWKTTSTIFVFYSTSFTLFIFVCAHLIL